MARCFNWSSPSVFTKYHVYLQMRLVMIKGVHHCESLPNWYVSCFTIDFNDSCSVESPGQEQPMLPDTNHVPQMQVSVAIKPSFFWGGRSLFISAETCWFEDPFPFLAAFFENAGRSPFPRLSLLGVVVIVAAAFGHLDEYHHVNLPTLSLIRDEWSDWDVASPQIRTASYRCLFQVLLNAAKQEYKEDLSMEFLEAGECTLPFTLRLS